MKTAIKAGVFAAIALTTIASAAQAGDDWGPWTAGIALTSDYRFRGQSQSDRDAAVQGWIQYDYKIDDKSGLFANVWSSNVDFNDAGFSTKDDTNVEVDLVLGYNYAFTDKTSGSLKALYYWYPDADYNPGANRYNYFEAQVGVAHDFDKFAVSGEIDWSPDYFNESGTGISVKGGASVPLMDKFAFMGALSASGNIGYQWIDDNATYATPDWLYYDLGLSAEWEIFTVDVRWVGTNTSKAKCFGGTNQCEDGIVVSLTANLPGGGE